jgi:hypothetical protein
MFFTLKQIIATSGFFYALEQLMGGAIKESKVE